MSAPGRSILAIILALAVALLVSSAGAAPSQISYQGQLKSSGALYTGIATMKFAIVDGTTSLWSNDSTSVGGSQPTTGVTVQVSNGLFTVQLGAPPMKPIGAQTVAGATNPVLRVWVSTGGGALDQLTDQPFTSVPYSLQGGGTDTLWIASAGNVYRVNGRVGIGTASPGAPLDVKGRIWATADQNGVVFQGLNGENNRIFEVDSYNSSDHSGMMRSFDASGDETIRLDAHPSTAGDQNISWYAPSTPGSMTSQFRIGRDGAHAAQLRVYQGNNTEPAAVFYNGGGSGPGLLIKAGSVGAPLANLLTLQSWDGSHTILNATGDGNVTVGTPSTPGQLAVNGPSTTTVLTASEAVQAPSLRTAVLTVSGTATTGVLEITGGSDLAERFDVSGALDEGNIQPGMVVTIDPTHPGGLQLATLPYDSRVAGVISGANGLAPGLVMKSEGKEGADGKHPVALSGRVWCWADATYGAIQPGDLLTTSSTPGMAMLAGDPARRSGAVLGKAMTALDSGRGLVLVLVSLQ